MTQKTKNSILNLRFYLVNSSFRIFLNMRFQNIEKIKYRFFFNENKDRKNLKLLEITFRIKKNIEIQNIEINKILNSLHITLT